MARYKKRSDSIWNTIWGLIGIIAFLFGICLFAFITIMDFVQDRQLSSRFGSHIDEYLHIADLKESRQAPQIAGKVITIDKVGNKADHLYFSLPEEIRANNPDEVETIVWLECTERVAGTYSSGTKGYRTICDVTIIDKASATIVGRETFYGEAPPQVKSGFGDWHGGRPTGEIVDYIENLSLIIQQQKAKKATAAAQVLQAKATATAQVLATTIAHSSWPLFLSDTFSSNENHWFTGDFSDEFATGSQLITNGTYRWEMKAHQSVGWWAFPDVSPVSDFYLTVEAKQVSGPESSSYGIVFRMVDDANYYVFLISDNGQFGLSLLHNNQWKTLIDWTRTSAIQPGKVNRLTVSAEGSYFVFFISDQFVSEMSDSQLSRGIAGVVVELYNANDAAIFEFDNFELRTPQALSLTLLSKGERLARKGKIKEAVAAYAEAQKLDPTLEIFSDSWNALCWFGSLWGYAADVIDACEQAVELAPDDGWIRDSRGLARALTGDYPGAIEDFKFCVEWLKENGMYEQYDGAMREAWIAELEAGRNPFDEDTLTALREE